MKHVPGTGFCHAVVVRTSILCAALVFAVVLQAFSPEGAQAKELRVQGVTSPIYNAQLSFPVPGTVGRIAVQPGQAVRAGELLMALESTPEDKRLELLENEIGNTVKIRILKSRAAQAKVDYERYKGALSRNAATTMETQHAKLTYDLSILALEEEEFRIEQLKRNYEELLAHRERMRLYAACDGFIEEVGVEVGMAVDKNVPAVRLVSVDPFYVDFAVPVQVAASLHVGTQVMLCRPGSTDCRPGVINQVGKVAVLSSGNLKVRVQAQNQQKIPVGMMLEGVFPVDE